MFTAWETIHTRADLHLLVAGDPDSVASQRKGSRRAGLEA